MGEALSGVVAAGLGVADTTGAGEAVGLAASGEAAGVEAAGLETGAAVAGLGVTGFGPPGVAGAGLEVPPGVGVEGAARVAGGCPGRVARMLSHWASLAGKLSSVEVKVAIQKPPLGLFTKTDWQRRATPCC